MSHFVNLGFRLLLVIALLLAQQAACAPAPERDMAAHAHGTGEDCHDDALPESGPGHAAHDDGTTDAGCPVSHGCPTMTAVAANPVAPSPVPAFVGAPTAPATALASVTLAPDRRPPKA